jgi:glycosidase
MSAAFRRIAIGLGLGAAVVAALIGRTEAQALAADYRARLPQDEVIYFVMPDRFENGDAKNDRGGLQGDRLKTGYDPTHTGYWHGGDLNGLTGRLDYLQGLGVTAIWFTPIFKNKPVQGPPGQESAGYHGYWVTDFTSVDPHLGTNDEFKGFVDAAHARGMKVYMDIIANHTADVIQYKGCPIQACGYRSVADYPYQRRGGPAGPAINEGFAGHDDQSPENFAKLTDPNYAYDVFVPEAERSVKKPDWLNDLIWYHNRGNSEWRGESVTTGDFSGLDDLMTENPRVVAGLIEVFGSWIDRYGIDGFRIDTAKHVNPEFWQAFVPAMLERARANGIPNFHIFGEVFVSEMDPAQTAVHTVVDKLPAVLDFPFARAVIDTAGGTNPPSELARLFRSDALYAGGEQAALQLPTFLGNHDAGRFAMFVRKNVPNADADEQLDRVILGHAMMLTLRGVPTIYYGDEQGFVSDGGDQGARESMFPSKVASYNDNDLLGSDRTTAVANFDTNHPIYRAISVLARLRTSTPALTRGLQKLRFAAEDKPGLFAVSRFDPTTGQEVLLLFNTSTQPVSQNVVVEVASKRFTALAGQCATEASAPGSVRVTLSPLSYAVCAAE